MNDQLNPRIYVACLASYNNGLLYGKWIECVDKSADDINKEIQDMLAISPVWGQKAEDWAVHDSEDLVIYGEYPLIDNLVAQAELIAEHGKFGLKVLEHFCGDVEEARNAIEDCYQGEYDSEEDYAEKFIEETGMLDNIADSLKWYFDYAKYARDLFINKLYYVNLGHKIHVFSHC